MRKKLLFACFAGFLFSVNVKAADDAIVSIDDDATAFLQKGFYSGREFYKLGKTAYNQRRYAEAKQHWQNAVKEGGLNKSDFETIITNMLSIGELETATEFAHIYTQEYPGERNAYNLYASSAKLSDKDTVGKAVEAVNAYNNYLRKQKSFTKKDRKIVFDNYNYLLSYYSNKGNNMEMANSVANKMSALYPNAGDETVAAIKKKLAINQVYYKPTNTPVKPVVVAKPTIEKPVEQPTTAAATVNKPVVNTAYTGITAESLLKKGDEYFLADKYDLAAQNWAAAEKLGSPIASRNLGILHEKALGVPQDYNKAREFYLAAAMKGVPDANRLMGNLFENGLGVEKNYPKAIDWYKRAVDLGDSTAKINVLAVEKLMKPAAIPAATSTVAAVQNIPTTKANTNPNTVVYTNTVIAGAQSSEQLYNSGYDAYKLKDYAKAAELWQKAAAVTKPTSAKYKAMNMLGQLYQNGEGVEKNYEKALEYFIGASANGLPVGNPDAAKSVGTLYENAWGVEEDFKEALSWYRKAQKMGNKYVAGDIKRMEEKIRKGL